MKNTGLYILIAAVCLIFAGCCHTHHRHTVIRTGYYERPRYEVVRPKRHHLPQPPKHGHKKRR
jgi:hypothetical protein